MSLILDKLGATIISMVIFLGIFAINIRNKQSLTETSAFFAVSIQTQAFADILRRDLQGIQSVVTVKGDPLFTFTSRIGTDTTLRTITYRKVFSNKSTLSQTQVDGSIVKVDTVTFYKIERLVDGLFEGGSSNIITEWNIVALNEDAGDITDPDDAAQVHVSFEAASPVFRTNVIESIHWESRFYPPLRN